MHYVGVDVAKATLEVSDSSGKLRRSFKNCPKGVRLLPAWLREHLGEEVQIVLEPTSTYHHLMVDELADRDISFTVINPARTKAYATLQARRAKTDRVDAQLLASLGESQSLRPSHRPDRWQERVKSLRRHREWLECEARSAKNRMEAASCSPWADAGIVKSLRVMIKCLKRQVAVMDRKLELAVEEDERFSTMSSLLETVPGVGRRTALLLLSEMPLASECDDARAWVAFSGVCPEPRQSGRMSYSRLSRVGSRRVRAGLYLPAIVAMSRNPAVAALVERLGAKGKTGKLVVMAAMNKLIRICFGVLRSMRPFDPALHMAHKTA